MIGLRNRIRLRQFHEAEAGDRNQYAIDCFREIRDHAEALRTPCVFFLIPVKPSRRHRDNEFRNVEYVFEQLDTVLADCSEADYSADPNNSHLNNRGHAKIAALIMAIFEERASSPLNRPRGDG